MAETGNSTGERGWYLYASDSGTTYSILTDKDLAEAGGLTPATQGTGAKPPGMRVRFVWAESVANPKKRRKVPCKPDSTLYRSAVSGTFTLAGEQFITTGRVGEKYSFPRFTPEQQ